jgi:RluA family pseudouridine synthase
MAGALRLSGRPLRAPGHVLQTGDVLDVTVRPELLLREDAPPPAVRILYEDAALIAVDKPPRVPTVATADRSRAHLVGLVERMLAERDGSTEARRPLGVHQRLDRDTSGVVLLVKDPAANAGLAEQFTARTIDKTYLALTRRGEREPLAAWRASGPVNGSGSGKAGAALPAVTDFRLIEALAGGLLVSAWPRTGRKHQIRIHLARAGLGILGDDTYGDGDAGAPRLMLHAARLRLRHPLTGAALSIESPMPADFLAVLEGLRRSPAPAARPRPDARMARAGRGTRRR